MAYAAQITVNDLKSIIRDQMLMVAFVVYPAMFILFARFLLPWINDNFYFIQPYYPMFFMLFIMFIPFIFSFVIGFLIIEERDQNLLTALRVTPISRNSYLAYRMLLITLFSFIYVVLSPALMGLVEVNYIAYLPVAVLFTLSTPIYALLVSYFANNKVQGFTMFKMMGILIFLPIFAFMIADNMKFVLGVIPHFWTFMAMDGVIYTGTPDLLYLGIGYVYHIALIGVLFYLFNRKI